MRLCVSCTPFGSGVSFTKVIMGRHSVDMSVSPSVSLSRGTYSAPGFGTWRVRELDVESFSLGLSRLKTAMSTTCLPSRSVMRSVCPVFTTRPNPSFGGMTCSTIRFMENLPGMATRPPLARYYPASPHRRQERAGPVIGYAAADPAHSLPRRRSMRQRGCSRIACMMLALALLGPRPAEAAETIRIGYLGPLTGIFAQAGKDMLDGLKVSLEQVNYQAGGRKIELLEEDTEGSSATAIAKYRKLIDHDKIHVLTGVLLANVGQSLVPLIERDQLPTLFLTTPDELTKRKVAKWILRSNFSASQIMHPLGDYAAKALKYRRVATIAMDNAFGHEEIGGFQRVFEDGGGKVVQKLWVPLNALDFAPYLSQVQKDVDAVCAVFVAGQAVRFVKQYGESGLKAKTPLIGTGVMTDESALRGMGDEAVGIVGALLWSPTLQNPANQVFMKLATAKVGRTPAYFTAIMYSSGRWIAEAAQSLNGQVEDREKLVAAIRRAIETVPDPRGPIKLDEYGNPTENVYIVRVEKSGGKLVNTVTYTYPSVSQFWTSKPEEFLKTPAYSRDYPPAKP